MSNGLSAYALENQNDAGLAHKGRALHWISASRALKILVSFVALLASIAFFGWITTVRFTPAVSLRARQSISRRIIRVCLDQGLLGTPGSSQQMGVLTVRLYPQDKSPCGSRTAAVDLRGADVIIPISLLPATVDGSGR